MWRRRQVARELWEARRKGYVCVQLLLNSEGKNDPQNRQDQHRGFVSSTSFPKEAGGTYDTTRQPPHPTDSEGKSDLCLVVACFYYLPPCTKTGKGDRAPALSTSINPMGKCAPGLLLHDDVSNCKCDWVSPASPVTGANSLVRFHLQYSVLCTIQIC